MSLLDEAIAAHCGAERWQAAEAVAVRQRAGGLVFVLKGRRNRRRRSTPASARAICARSCATIRSRDCAGSPSPMVP
jgi:hypothetical protein